MYLLHYPNNFTASRVYDAAARERRRHHRVNSSLQWRGFENRPRGDMLPRYRAAQSHWASFTFGVIALALGIMFQRGRVLGYCTPQPASIPEIKKGDCLDERIPSQEDTHTARTSKEKNNDNCDYNWETQSPWYITAKCKNVDRLWTFLCEPMFGPNIRFWVDFASSRLENTSFGLEPSGTLTVGPLLRRR